MTTGRPRVINLWAGPGIGKSRNAAMLFNTMKADGRTVELVTEAAKHYTYERNPIKLLDQFGLMVEQEYRQKILIDHVEWIVTDSPPALATCYCKRKDWALLVSLAMHFRERYENFDVLLERDKLRPYQQFGRNESEAEAAETHEKVRHLFYQMADPARRLVLVADENAAATIFSKINYSVPWRREL